MSKYFLVALLLLSFSLTDVSSDTKGLGPEEKKLARPPIEAGDLSGLYEFRGSEGESKYQGIAILKKHNDGYLVQWSVDVGSNNVGMAVRDGERLLVSWVAGGKLGMTIYRIKGKRLEGQWLSAPMKVWHSENMERIGDFPIEEKGA